MPRKNKSPTVKVRLRDNQRQSRARKRELFEDMQQRLREFEQREVQATLEMQHAAREVALENQRLRDLLARHGISTEEIELSRHSGKVAIEGTGHSFSAHHKGDWNPPASNAQSACRDAPSSLPAMSSPGAAPHGRSPGLHSPPTRSSGMIPLAAANRNPTAAGRVGNEGLVQEERNIDDDEVQDSNMNLYDSNASFNSRSSGNHSSSTFQVPAPTPEILDAATSAMTGTETSCEAAATILARVQGHGDKNLAFATLGCSGTKDCVVRNIKIFDLMD